jgi:hypothetical protein
MDNLSSLDTFICYMAKERILYILSNIRSSYGTSLNNSQPQHEADPVSSSYAMISKKKKKEASTSSNLGSKKCNWGHKHSPGTVSGHICIQCKELKARRHRNSPQM